VRSGLAKVLLGESSGPDSLSESTFSQVVNSAASAASSQIRYRPNRDTVVLAAAEGHDFKTEI
jgi:hypothetical protein